MAGFAEYDDYDGLGLGELVRRGDVQPAELVEESFQRIEARNPAINAVVRPLHDLARGRPADSTPDGPFAGVPFLVKDLIQCIPGVPTESGSVFWRDWTPKFETNLYKRWLEAGVVPVGKTATSELGLRPVTETDLYGATRNPWDTGRTPGGSSGGSGAAVAAGITPVASGGDGGGSIRIPASCCGLFGHRPSRARNPVGPAASEHWFGFVSEHVLSRSVRDSAAMLDATNGPDATAPYFAAPIEGTFLAATQQDPRPLRIAFHSEPAFPAIVHPDCRDAVEDAARLCAELGHEVTEISPQHAPEELGRALAIALACDTAAQVKRAERVVGRKATHRDFQLSTWITHLLGKAVSGEACVTALETLRAEARRMVGVFDGFDLILTPTLGSPPIEIGSLEPQGMEAAAQKLIARARLTAPLSNPSLIDLAAKKTFSFVPFTAIANITGRPSMSVPLHWNRDGLPIGVMFTGRPTDEIVMFGLAAQLERARPWAGRRPPKFW